MALLDKSVGCLCSELKRFCILYGTLSWRDFFFNVLLSFGMHSTGGNSTEYRSSEGSYIQYKHMYAYSYMCMQELKLFRVFCFLFSWKWKRTQKLYNFCLWNKMVFFCCSFYMLFFYSALLSFLRAKNGNGKVVVGRSPIILKVSSYTFAMIPFSQFLQLSRFLILHSLPR